MGITDPYYFQVKAIAEGIIKCLWCSNDNSQGFHFYSEEPSWVGGCGLCGTLHYYTGGKWIKFINM